MRIPNPLRHRRPIVVVLAAGALGLVMAMPAPALADDKGDARRFFNAAQEAFKEGRYVDAARAYEEAARLAPHPAPVINAGDAWQKAGEYAQAARAFQRALKMKEASEQDRVDATDRLARLQPKLGIIELIGASTMRARVDDNEIQGGERVYVFPGEHTVTLVGIEGAKTRTLNVAAGTARTVELDSLRPVSGETASGESGSGSGNGEDGGTTSPSKAGISPLTWVAYGVGAVGLGVGGFFGLQANGDKDDFNAAVDDGDGDGAQKAFDSFGDNKRNANIGVAIGGVGLVTGTVLLITGLLGGDSEQTGGPSPARPQRVSKAKKRGPDVGFTATGSGGAIFARGRF